MLTVFSQTRRAGGADGSSNEKLVGEPPEEIIKFSLILQRPCNIIRFMMHQFNDAPEQSVFLLCNCVIHATFHCCFSYTFTLLLLVLNRLLQLRLLVFAHILLFLIVDFLKTIKKGLC